MRYVVVYGRTPNNYSASVPDLPVVVVVGDTLEELAAEAREAIAFHLEGEGREAEAFEIDLVAIDEYDGDLLTLAGERVPARLVVSPAMRRTASKRTSRRGSRAPADLRPAHRALWNDRRQRPQPLNHSCASHPSAGSPAGPRPDHSASPVSVHGVS